jgi:hypothetical protein
MDKEQIIAQVEDYEPLVGAGKTEQPHSTPAPEFDHRRNPGHRRRLRSPRYSRTLGEALCLGLAAGVYLSKPNMRELRQIVQQEIETEAQMEAALQGLIDQGHSEMIILLLGAAYRHNGRR